MPALVCEFGWLIIVVAVVWTLSWKTIALWKAARLGQRWWFMALLVINTLGLLEILYLFVFSRRKTSALG